jgi:hypothetical protein
VFKSFEKKQFHCHVKIFSGQFALVITSKNNQKMGASRLEEKLTDTSKLGV